MKEIWKDIKGYEGIYRISNTGKVLSLERTVKSNNSTRVVKRRILKPVVNSKGFNCTLRVGLCKNSKIKHYSVNSLLTQTFLNITIKEYRNLFGRSKEVNINLEEDYFSKKIIQKNSRGSIVSIYKNILQASYYTSFNAKEILNACKCTIKNGKIINKYWFNFYE